MTDREKKLNTDREWLADELMRAGSPALPSSLSAAALFERMDAEEQRAAEPAAPAPEKKGGVIWLQWRRWGSAAAVLVLAVGVAFLLQNGTLQKKSFKEPAPADPGYDMAMAPNGAENRDLWNGSDGEVPETGGPGTDGLMMAPPPNPTTAGGDGDSKNKENPPSGQLNFGQFEDIESEILASPGELPTPDLTDFDAMAAVSSQLFGGDYDQAIAMFYDSGERWEGCELPTSCAHYFMLDKTLYGFFPEERRVVDYSGACATVLNEDEAAMLSAILQIEFTAKTE